MSESQLRTLRLKIRSLLHRKKHRLSISVTNRLILRISGNSAVNDESHRKMLGGHNAEFLKLKQVLAV